jgi:hypothetical protein
MPLRASIRGEPVIAVELTRNLDHPVDAVEIAIAHRAVRDEHRLAQAADLQLYELMRRVDDAALQNRSLALPRPFHRYPFAGRGFLVARWRFVFGLSLPATSAMLSFLIVWNRDYAYFCFSSNKCRAALTEARLRARGVGALRI